MKPRRPRFAARIALAVGCALSLAPAACGHDVEGPRGGGPQYPYTNVQPPIGGVAQFSYLPVEIAPGLTLTALGNLNPPGHTVPTTHVYFYDWDLSKSGNTARDVRKVTMPATAALFMALPGTNGEYKLMFRATENFYFMLAHMVPTVPVNVGQVYVAGTEIGQTLPGATLDLGAFDSTVTHTGFARPERYSFESRHYVSPWKYFTAELQARIYPHVYRIPSAQDRDGRADFDQPGRLVGSWFVRGLPDDSSDGPTGWPKTIAFAYDYFDPSQVRIAIGGTVDAPGVWAISPSAPRPEEVTPRSGIVAYDLYPPFDKGFPPVGRLLVQMADDGTIKVEVLRGAAAATLAEFDGSASTFVR